MPDPISDLNADGRINADDRAMHDFAAGQPRTPRSNQSRLRVNLDRPSGSSTFHLFIDALKSGRGLGVDAGPLDEIVFTDQTHADGSYNLFVDNKACKVTAAGAKVSAANSGVHVVIVPKGGAGLTLKYSEHPGKRSLIRPGYSAVEAKRIITREAAKQLAPFGGIRFMDFLATNGSKVTSPADRPKLDWDSWAKGGYGAPVEAAIEIGNVLGKDIWICIPHAATDAYVAEVADLLTRLRPDVNCYVEYSNEVWNSISPFNVQRDYALLKVAGLVVDGDKTLHEPDGKYNATNALWRWVTRRGVEIKKILGKRVRMVLASQIGYGTKPAEAGHQARHQLDYLVRQGIRPADYFYAISGAPYFSSGSVAQGNPALTKEQYAEALMANIGSGWSDKCAAYKALAVKHGLKFIAYEGGTHDHVAAAPQAVIDGQSLPRTGEAVEKYLNKFFDGGGDQFYYFSAGARWYWRELSPPGPKKGVLVFGLTSGTYATSPKYDAAVRVAAKVKA